jgi:integrase
MAQSEANASGVRIQKTPLTPRRVVTQFEIGDLNCHLVKPELCVKEQLGHSSIKMTVDIYGHWIPGANRQAVNRLPGLSTGTSGS